MKLIIIYTLEIAFNVNPANLLIQFKAALNAKMFAKNAKKAILIIVLLAKITCCASWSGRLRQFLKFRS